jgi:lysophospholipase L1-like esterase
VTGERLLFLGASLIEQGDWAAWFDGDEVINQGVSGDTTADVLARIDQVIEADPDSIVLLIGGNDFARRRSVEQVVRTIENIMVELRRRLPGARLLLLSITPRSEDYAQRIQDANRHLRQFAATVRAQYLDLWPALSDGDVLAADFTTDGVHFTDAGYQAFVDELRPALERLREEPPMSRPITIIRESGSL